MTSYWLYCALLIEMLVTSILVVLFLADRGTCDVVLVVLYLAERVACDIRIGCVVPCC